MNNRLKLQAVGQHWSSAVAEVVEERFPGLPVYTSAAGISPSGIVHFGNFRDVMTAVMVADALKAKDKKVRIIFSWDDYDRFRKVPVGVPAEFVKYIGMPLTSVPDPTGEFPSYAARFEEEFERAMRQLGIELEYRYQTKEYKSGRYDDLIFAALNARAKIAQVLLSFMSDKGKAEKQIDPEQYAHDYYPISLYSRFSGKDSTKILSFDGVSKVEYLCVETGKQEVVDLKVDRIVKLAWKIDWPMRWGVEGVVFEPGGKDHASPGGSYDVSSAVAQQVFGRPAPVFVGYEFIGIQGLGGKMSGSKGNAVSPAQLLEIYEEPLLKWIYSRKNPEQSFSLAFDSEIFRQYDEMDREVAAYRAGTLEQHQRRALEISFAGSEARLSQAQLPIPFRQTVGLGQILQWNTAKVKELSRRLSLEFSDDSIDARIPKAKSWLESYNPDQLIAVLTQPNSAHIETMSEEARGYVQRLREALVGGMTEIEDIEPLLYGIPKLADADKKVNSIRQRAFFKDVYKLLINDDTGPRLATFLWAANREQILNLLDI